MELGAGRGGVTGVFGVGWALIFGKDKSYFFFFFLVYSFILRERETERAEEGQGERERERIPSRLQAQHRAQHGA